MRSRRPKPTDPCHPSGHDRALGLRGLLVLVTLLAVASHDLSAQAVLKGRIRGAQSETPLALVEVLIENLKKREWTNDSGDFRISDIPIGTHELRVRRIGFEGAIATLKVESADSLYIDLSLNAWVPELEEIYVKAPRRSRLMQELEEKRRIGFGRFVLPEEMRDNEHRSIVDLIRQMGIEVLIDPKTMRAYPMGRKTPTFASPTTQCMMPILLNGVRLGEVDLNQFQVSQLDGIEAYRRASEMPVQYSGPNNNCGVLILWARGA